MATPTPDPNYLVAVQPTDTEGIKWAKVGAQLLQCLINAGISMTPNPPYSDAIQPTDTEGLKWAKLGYFISQLSGGLSPVSSVLQSGSVAIGNGVQDGIVATFSTPFASAPKVVAVVCKTDNTKSNYFVTAYTATPTGFTCDLQAPTDDATYTLKYLATL